MRRIEDSELIELSREVIVMPTYRIRDRAGKILDAAIQADSEFSAAAAYDLDTVTIEEISPNPPATVYTIAFPLETLRGTEIVEVCSTGSRSTALRELSRENSGNGNGNSNGNGKPIRTLIEESRAVNQQQAKGRRS